jgi:hypothetical protein
LGQALDIGEIAMPLPSLRAYSLFATAITKLADPNNLVSPDLESLPIQLEERVKAIMDIESATYQPPEQDARPLLTIEKFLRCTSNLDWEVAQVYFDQLRKESSQWAEVALYRIDLGNAFKNNQAGNAIKFLIANGANFSQKYLFKNTSRLATKYGNTQMLDWLSNHGELPHDKLLMLSAHDLNVASVKYFLAKTTDSTLISWALSFYQTTLNNIGNRNNYYANRISEAAESLQLNNQQLNARTTEIRDLLQGKLNELTLKTSAPAPTHI